MLMRLIIISTFIFGILNHIESNTFGSIGLEYGNSIFGVWYLSVSAKIIVESWIDTNTYNISVDNIWKEKDSHGLSLEIKDDILIAYVDKPNMNLICKFPKHYGDETVPSCWHMIFPTKPSSLTSFYSDYSIGNKINV